MPRHLHPSAHRLQLRLRRGPACGKVAPRPVGDGQVDARCRRARDGRRVQELALAVWALGGANAHDGLKGQEEPSTTTRFLRLGPWEYGTLLRTGGQPDGTLFAY